MMAINLLPFFAQILILLFIGLCYCNALKDRYERNHIHDKINEGINAEEKEDLHE